LKHIEEILTTCIEEIRTGKTTLEECLARYPEIRRELEPLLKTAINIKKPLEYQMEAGYKKAARARLMQQIRPIRRKRVNFADILSLGIPRQYAGIRATVAALVVIMVITMMGGGTAYASQSTVPGDTLYQVKIGTENARLLVAGSSEAKAELNMEFASRRLGELTRVANNNEEKAKEAVNGYRRNLEEAIQQSLKINDVPVLTGLLDNLANRMQDQIKSCDQLIDGEPSGLHQVTTAESTALENQIQILETLAQYDGLKASEHNIKMMQYRLQRALNTANTGNYQNMDRELKRYRDLIQLGQQILSIAETTNNQVDQIKVVNFQQLSTDLMTLDSLAQQVPDQYQGTINICTQITIQFQHRARYGQQGQDGNSPGPGGTGEENDGSTNPGTGGTSTNSPPDQGSNTTGDSKPIATTSPTNGGNGTSDNQTGPQNGPGPDEAGNGQGPGAGGPP
jgi:hypothetical protein